MSVTTIVKYDAKNQAITKTAHGSTRLIKRQNVQRDVQQQRMLMELRDLERRSMLGLTLREYYVKVGYVRPRG